jgi:hypothetical protein
LARREDTGAIRGAPVLQKGTKNVECLEPNPMSCAVGKLAIRDGAFQSGEQSRQPDGSKARTEAGETERKADAIGSVRLNET